MWSAFIQHPRNLLVVASMMPGPCSDPEPCPGVEKGAEFEVTVYGVHDPDELPDMCEEWGFEPDATFQGTVVDLVGDKECKSGLLDVSGVGEWKWELHGPGGHGGSTIETSYRITSGSCAGVLTLDLTTTDGECDAKDGSGEACRIRIQLAPDNGKVDVCPERCTGILDVRVDRL